MTGSADDRTRREQPDGSAQRLTRQDLLRLGAALGVAPALLAAAGCGGSSSGSSATTSTTKQAGKKGGTLHAAFSDFASKENLDPALGANWNQTIYCVQVYEGLTSTDIDWNVHPVLATKWHSNADATEWVFTLRQGVKFHDGSPLTSKDVVFSLKRILDKSLGAIAYGRLAASVDADGIQAPSPDTVVLKLKRPDALLPLALASYYIKVVKDGTREFMLRTAIGTGPFKFSSWKPGQSWAAVKNPDYWDPRLPHLDGIESVVIPDQSTKVQSVVSGNTDFGDQVDFSAATSIVEPAALITLENQQYIDVAMDQTQKPFTDERVVTAIKLAQDRQTILQTALQGYGEATSDTPEPPSDPFYPAALGVREQNIEKAKQLLADAGYPNGIDLELFTAPSTGGMVETAVSLQQVVKPAGINIKVKQWPTSTYWDQVWLVKPMFVSYWNRRHPAEALSVTYTSNSPHNECKLKDPELDLMVAQSLATTDPAKQKEILGKALLRVADKHGTLISGFEHALWVRKQNVSTTGFDLLNGLLKEVAFTA